MDLSDSECGSVLPPIYSRLQSRLNPVPESLNSPDIVPGTSHPSTYTYQPVMRIRIIKVGSRSVWRDTNPDLVQIKQMCGNMAKKKKKKFFHLDFFLHFYNFLLMFKISFLSYIRFKHKYILFWKLECWGKIFKLYIFFFLGSWSVRRISGSWIRIRIIIYTDHCYQQSRILYK